MDLPAGALRPSSAAKRHLSAQLYVKYCELVSFKG